MKYKYDISIVVPSIRPYNLERLYTSMVKSCTQYTWEMIFIGPYQVPITIYNKDNTKAMKDSGSPVRAAQIGAACVEGRLISWQADDAWYLDTSMDRILSQMDSNRKTVLTTKYREVNDLTNDQFLLEVSYGGKCTFINSDWIIFNNAVMTYEYFCELGGWDAMTFEVGAVSHADLAARAQIDGANVKALDIVMSECDHFGALGGDHAPVHYGHLEDLTKYRGIYNSPSCKDRVRLSMDNWKSASRVWNRRFKEVIE